MLQNQLDPEFPIHDNTDKLFLSEYGTAGKVMALGIQGSKTFRTKIENMLINFSIVGLNAQYHPLFDNFGYFVVDPQKLYYGMENTCMVDFWIENRKKYTWDNILSGVGRAFYKLKAKRWFESITREDFMHYTKGTNNHFFYSKMYKEKY